MEVGCARAEALDIEADVVARQQSAVAIEGGVLDCLRCDRCAQLAKARDGLGVGRRITHPAIQQIDHPAVAGEAAPPGALDGAFEERSVARRAIGSIDGKMHQQLGDRPSQRRPAEVAGRRLRCGKAPEGGDAGLELSREAAGDDLPAGGHFFWCKVGGPAADRRPG